MDPPPGIEFFEPKLESYALYIIGKDGRMLVAVKSDGSVIYGPNYSPDKAAKAFWEAMGRYSRPEANKKSPKVTINFEKQTRSIEL